MPYHDPQLAPTVYQIIQRTGILYPVIDDLKLQDKWGQGGNRPPPCPLQRWRPPARFRPVPSRWSAA